MKVNWQKIKDGLDLTPIIWGTVFVILVLGWFEFIFKPIDLILTNANEDGIVYDPKIILAVGGFLVLSIWFICTTLTKIIAVSVEKLILKIGVMCEKK